MVLLGRSLKVCCVPVASAASSKGIFVAATNSTNKAGSICHQSIFLRCLWEQHTLATCNESLYSEKLWKGKANKNSTENIRTACIRHQCRKTTVKSCHRCLINTGVEKMNSIQIYFITLTHQMSLSKSKFVYSNNCLHFSKCIVPLLGDQGPYSRHFST